MRKDYHLPYTAQQVNDLLAKMERIINHHEGDKTITRVMQNPSCDFIFLNLDKQYSFLSINEEMEDICLYRIDITETATSKNATTIIPISLLPTTIERNYSFLSINEEMEDI